MFGVSLNPREMGFNSLEELFKSVSHLVQIVTDGSNQTKVRLVKAGAHHADEDESAATTTQDTARKQTTKATTSNNKNNSNGDITSPSFSSNSSSDSLESPRKSNNEDAKNKQQTQIVDENNNLVAKSTTTKNVVETKPSVKKPLTAKQQVVYEMVRLIVSAGEKGMNLMSIGQAYEKMYGRALDFEKFGYTSATKFIVENLPKTFQTAQAKAFGDFTFYTLPGKSIDEMMMLHSDNNNKNDSKNNSDEAIVQIVDKKTKLREKLKQLREDCVSVLKEYLDKRVCVSEFWRMFEAKHGWRPLAADYECQTYEDLAGKLFSLNAFMIEMDQRHRLYVYMPSKQSLRSPPYTLGQNGGGRNGSKSSSSSNTKELSVEEVSCLTLKKLLVFDPNNSIF